MCHVGDFQVSSSPVSCSGEMEYWTEAAVHATLGCSLLASSCVCFLCRPLLLHSLWRFFYVALVAASRFFVAALTALSCCVFRNAQHLK